VAKRDLAVVVGVSQPAGTVLDEIRRSAKGLLAGLSLFDVYEGDPLPPGKKSLAVALELQAGDRTLTDDEVEKVLYRVRRTLENRVGAEFRT
jgi:phenylalanyl-tRNA synthetase beta chain